jgi:hypothetical protein
VIGWVPLVVVGFLDEIAGVETRKAILTDAGLDPEAVRFRLDTDLPDPAGRRIIEAACARLGVTEDVAFTLFAPYFLRRARGSFPGFFKGVSGTRAFLLNQPAIHNSLATGLRDPQRRAVADKFRVVATPNGLRVHYNSPNRMAALYVAVAHELAKSYGESIAISFQAGTPDSVTCVMQVNLVVAGASVAEVTTSEVMTKGPS